MKRIVALGFLTILTISCSQKVLTKPSGLNPDRTIAVLPAYSSPKRDIFYLSRQFGFRFVQPSGYVTVNATKSLSPKSNATVQVLEIWRQEDYANRIYLTESPAMLSITIYNNSRHLPLENWKTNSAVTILALLRSPDSRRSPTVLLDFTNPIMSCSVVLTVATCFTLREII